MTEIYVHGNRIDSIFQLLGEEENDISHSVAWALAKCPTFLVEFLKNVLDKKIKSDEIEIRLQHSETDRGITDVELELINEFFIIVEAKKGWNLPDSAQLKKYAKRKSFKKSVVPIKKIVVLSECSTDFANYYLDSLNIGDIEVIPISWKSVYLWAIKAREKGTHAEKHLLDELITYLGGLMTMQNINSNLVYVVALGEGFFPSIESIKKRLLFAHPMGVKGWPKDPPNYIAFRYDGKLQSIHHIKDYEVVTNLHKHFPEELDDEECAPHFVYKLGPAFAPTKELRIGQIYRVGRVWCMLDTLFTCKTLSEAVKVSRRREE